MNMYMKTKYKTYEYRIYPTAEPQKLLAAYFDFEDAAYNELAVEVNALFAQGAQETQVFGRIQTFTFDCPGGEYRDALKRIKKELCRAAERLYEEKIEKIHPHGACRTQRSFGFQTAAISEFYVVFPVVGAILRESRQDLPQNAKILGGQVLCSVYENFYRASIRVACSEPMAEASGMQMRQAGRRAPNLRLRAMGAVRAGKQTKEPRIHKHLLCVPSYT